MITNPLIVVKMWASAVRPSVRRAQPTGYEKPGQRDDLRGIARVRVELIPTFYKAYPLLRKAFVHCVPGSEKHPVVISFLAELKADLKKTPIYPLSDDPGEDGFYVPLGIAMMMLREAYPQVDGKDIISEKTVSRWCDKGWVGNYKKGRERMVRWKDVRDRAPRRKKEETPKKKAKKVA